MATKTMPASNRKVGIARQPDGRPTQSKKKRKAWEKEQKRIQEDDALSTARWQRMNQYGEVCEKLKEEAIAFQQKLSKEPVLSVHDVFRSEASTLHGRMHLAGELDRDQYEAAEWFLINRNAYLLAIGAPGGISDLPEGYTPTGDEDAHADHCKKIKSIRADIEREVIDTQQATLDFNIVGALDLFLIRQEYNEDYVGSLRYGLNAIYRIMAGKK